MTQSYGCRPRVTQNVLGDVRAQVEPRRRSRREVGRIDLCPSGCGADGAQAWSVGMTNQAAEPTRPRCATDVAASLRCSSARRARHGAPWPRAPASVQRLPKSRSDGTMVTMWLAGLRARSLPLTCSRDLHEKHLRTRDSPRNFHATFPT